MKPCILLSFAALATALVERDSAPYKKVVDSITSNVDKLDSAVNDFDGKNKKPVTDASDALIKSIDDGTKTISGLDTISASDAIPLTSSIRSLNDKSQTLTKDLKSKRGDVEKANACGDVRKAVTDLNSSAQKLVDAAISKIPKGLQNVAEGFTSDFTKTFEDTKDYFSESNCKNGSGGDDSSSSTGSSSGTGTSNDQPSKTDSASADKTNGASLLNPAAALGVVMLGFAVYV